MLTHYLYIDTEKVCVGLSVCVIGGEGECRRESGGERGKERQREKETQIRGGESAETVICGDSMRYNVREREKKRRRRRKKKKKKKKRTKKKIAREYQDICIQ